MPRLAGRSPSGHANILSSNLQSMKNPGEHVVRIEAEALRALADRIAGPMAQAFQQAVEMMFACSGRVVVTGMGKSGLIARKIAATLSSTGTPALYLHPVEALHGDLGMIVRGDLVLALSASGETEEILALVPTIKRLRVPLIAMTGDEIVNHSSRGARRKAGNSSAHPVAKNATRVGQPLLMKRSSKAVDRSVHPARSTLAAAADVALDCSIAQEACALGLAPTASTTAMLALGDALAVTLSEQRGFKEEDFANLHPGGKLGKRLARVESLMHTGEELPCVGMQTRMPDVIYEMSRKKLGVTAVIEGKKLVGVISDGDLRRLLEKRGKDVLELTAGEAMTRNPKTIAPGQFAASALALMEEKKITSLMVVDASDRLQGILHLHDLWGVEMV
ncbi:MAG: SIS domain-containing protein [Candidatus Sulfotelmatobacter sp.]